MTRKRVKSQIRKLLQRYERQLGRGTEKERDLENRKERLSVHGHFELGFYGGKNFVYEKVIDDLKDLLANDLGGENEEIQG